MKQHFYSEKSKMIYFRDHLTEMVPQKDVKYYVIFIAKKTHIYF